ncbi:MAG: PcfJ domain-containing protein [Clostridia bacterium]|nr:PcfJ domain-containing protein [Clostridia bacterium]
MLIEKIKPIPKYIEKQIIKKYKQSNYAEHYYSYLTKNNSELVEILVATKLYKGDIYIKQVACHGIDSKEAFIKDMNFSYLAGYRVGWHAEGITKTPKWWEDDRWWKSYDEYYNPYSVLLNPEYATKQKEFKYALVEKVSGVYIFTYLRLFREFPEMESLEKMGLACLVYSKQILKKFRKDTTFRKWLYKNKANINNHRYRIGDIISAYNKHIEIVSYCELADFRRKYKDFDLSNFGTLNKFFDYIKKQDTNVESYKDYMLACQELEIDTSLPKNYMPHNFKYWHDVRIDQLNALKAERDRKAREALYNKFAIVSNKYASLQKLKGNMYVAIIPTSPADLMHEGDCLHHCVGKMNYDAKFSREETLIFFIRDIQNIKQPLVTIEYSLREHKVLQCYGDHDTKPNEQIENFVFKQWLPYANRQLKKIA